MFEAIVSPNRSMSPDAGSALLSFQEIWDSLAPLGDEFEFVVNIESNGSCRSSMDDAVRRLQRLLGLGTGMSMSVIDASTLPFIGIGFLECYAVHNI